MALRVSLHCKGCEAKLRKHLSKMEGEAYCELLDLCTFFMHQNALVVHLYTFHFMEASPINFQKLKKKIGAFSKSAFCINQAT